MSTAPTFDRFATFACRTAALAAFACTSIAGAHAQAIDFTKAPAPMPLVASTDDGPLDLAHSAGVSYSSSESPAIDAVDASAPERLHGEGLDAAQPPPRRRYGRPRYNDSSHNADGSSKYAFIAGGGFTLATGNTYHYLNTNYGFQVGAGRNFSKNFSLLLQFDWDAFGFNGRTLANQQNLYNFGLSTASPYYIPQLDGNSHIWSFTLDPVYNIYAREGVGAYVVGGVGFYHKVANFTVPETGYEEDAFGDIYQVTANQTIDHYTSNAVGFNGGFGLTYKPSRFSSQRLYAEARYVFIDNKQVDGYNASNPNYNLNYNGYNAYRPNSNRTTYVPIKFGIRF